MLMNVHTWYDFDPPSPPKNIAHMYQHKRHSSVKDRPNKVLLPALANLFCHHGAGMPKRWQT